MRTYEEAKALAEAGVTEITEYGGERTRKVSFRASRFEDVVARFHETDIVTWHRTRVITVNLVGPNPEFGAMPGTSKTVIFDTRMTFDAIAAALGISRARVGKVKGVPYVNGMSLAGGSATFSLT